jgi:hypothetical protein
MLAPIRIQPGSWQCLPREPISLRFSSHPLCDYLDHDNASPGQHRRQLDQRQTNQRIWVIAVDILDERDAETFTGALVNTGGDIEFSSKSVAHGAVSGAIRDVGFNLVGA